MLRDDEGIERLFHIARMADWEQAQRDGVYRVSSLGKLLDDEGLFTCHLPIRSRPSRMRSIVA